MENYDSVSVALSSLKKRGYKTDFNIAFDKLICNETKICLEADEFEITEVYRFEGESNPSDEAIVYAIESKNGDVKGVFVNAFGPYADPISDAMIKKLSLNRNNVSNV